MKSLLLSEASPNHYTHPMEIFCTLGSRVLYSYSHTTSLSRIKVLEFILLKDLYSTYDVPGSVLMPLQYYLTSILCVVSLLPPFTDE